MTMHKHNTGVTLIELMLALAISAILMLGVGTIYSSSKRGYIIQEEFARMQESARFALKFLVEDMRMAGFVGCAWNNNLDYQDFLQGTDDFMSNFRVGLEGLEANTTGPGDNLNLATPSAGWHSAPPAVIAGNVPGSDILIVRHARDSGARMSENKASANFTLFDQGNDLVTVGGRECHIPSDICEGDVLLASDCSKSRLFQATELQKNPGVVRVIHSATGTPGNDPSSWGGASEKHDHFAKEDTQILQASAYAYYVGTSAATGEPALYRISARPGSAAEELVEGIENMQVLYGIDTDKTAIDDQGDGIANRYVPASQVNFAIDNVVSARISLLIRTPGEIPRETAAAADTYLLGGATAASAVSVTTPADHRIRKIFTTTVKVRNKGL